MTRALVLVSTKGILDARKKPEPPDMDDWPGGILAAANKRDVWSAIPRRHADLVVCSPMKAAHDGGCSFSTNRPSVQPAV